MRPIGTWFDPVFLSEIATGYPCESRLTAKEIKRVIKTTERYHQTKVSGNKNKVSKVYYYTTASKR